MGLPDITWDGKTATILPNFQGHLFILFKKHRNVFVFKENFTIDRKSSDQKVEVPCYIQLSHFRAVDGIQPIAKTKIVENHTVGSYKTG